MKKIICPLCKAKYANMNGLINHIDKVHSDSLPEDYSPARYLYLLRTGREHGKCVECGAKTEWNPSTNKYHRFCGNPKCKEAYIERFKKRMIGKYGKENLLNDPEHQRKMLAHRKISGEYRWSDGKSIKTYTGSYEKDFLRFLDVFMNFPPEDIFAPSPHTYTYEYEGETKFYIPDFYIASLDMEIEIKDGGDNPNTHHKIQAVDKVKEKAKDDVMYSLKDKVYLKLENKGYGKFMQYLVAMQEAILSQ